MRCSVVMTTYNGSKFVRRQLDSIHCQKRQPDEVVIFDDCSTDDTVNVVEQYIRDNHLDNWTVSVNTHNLGWKANFMQALDKASGDILFPCDQDDSWMPEKLELMARELEDNDNIKILACDTKIEYEQGSVNSKHYEGEETKEEGAIARYPLTTRFFMNPRPGNTYAIRKEFFDRVKEYWQQDYPHDEYLWISAALSGGAYFINRQLVEFHRHAGNTSDIRYKDIKMQKVQLDYIGKSIESFTQLIDDRRITPLPKAMGLLEQAKVWCNKRKKLMETRNPFRWLMMAPWWKYYNSNKNALSDVFLVVFGKFKR